jgi:hypothetical protein
LCLRSAGLDACAYGCRGLKRWPPYGNYMSLQPKNPEQARLGNHKMARRARHHLVACPPGESICSQRHRPQAILGGRGGSGIGM